MADISNSPAIASEYDVVVVGSGAGGLSAALTASHLGLDVLVVEKTDYVGGSTAVSGGAVWIPNSPHFAETGLSDSRENVVTYLKAILGNRFHADRIEAFLNSGPEMVKFFEAHTHVKFSVRTVGPDYRPDTPGAAAGGRTIDPLPFDGRQLGDDFRLLRPPHDVFTVFGGMMVNRVDVEALLGATGSTTKLFHAAKLVARYGADRLRYPRGTRLLMGNALAARLLKSALEQKITITRRTAATSLVVENGRLSAIELDIAGSKRRIRARRGVVLATGGFAASAEVRKLMMPHPDVHHSMTPEGNVGDGLRLAQAVGAHLATDNSGSGFWTPISVMKTRSGREVKFPHLILDRPKPGSIAVDQRGNRFVNEATSYHDFVEAMYRAHNSVPTIPAFLICDRRFIRTYGLGLARPKHPIGGLIKSGYLLEGKTLADLARQMAVPLEALTRSVDQMNEAAMTGVDTLFGKGSNIYNRYLGDPHHKPNPCLGPIDQPPFYAVRLYPGDIGSATGIVTDASARVLDETNRPIPGLYACGNDMNSIMSGAYPGAGITLGPALTFGFIAGKALAA